MELSSVTLPEEEDTDEEACCPEAYAMVPTCEEDEPEVSSAVAVVGKKRKRRRFFGRLRRLDPARIGAPSWWTECKNVDASGCTFVLAYLALSFVLMTLMFNMREIVGDHLLGNGEQKREEYRENLEKAMELRRRNPYSADEENRFEKELAADLYYDKQGQTAEDSSYFLNHRVPIILREDEFEDEEFEDP